MKQVSILIAILFQVSYSFGQALYDANTIQTIKIKFSQANWDYRMDTAKAGAEGYLMADSVYINGVGYDSVGVKYKGNSTYNANQTKNPFHIELDTYKPQDYQGYNDIKLANVAYDPSFVREATAYKILENYMACPKANYANVYINGNLIGLYTNTEAIGKSFAKEHFGSKNNAFFNCSPPGGAGPQSTNLPNFAYLGTNSASYISAYDMKSDTGWASLINLTSILSTTTSSNTANLEAVLDVDRALWMLAFDNLMVNLDSYIGQFKQNHYLYKSDNGQFMPIIWDLNMSFGVFGSTGSGGNLSTATKKTMSPTLHSTESAWPLVQKLLAVPTYKKKYIAHYKTILTEMIANGQYIKDADSFKNLILASVNADANKFSYQSAANMSANIGATAITVTGGGNNTAPGLTDLMSARNTYLNGLAEFSATEPIIAGVNVTTASPIIGGTVNVTASITNAIASSVYLGVRKSKFDYFTKSTLYDDGLHNDGLANDNVFGGSFTINDSTTQYYIYAENANAGKFAPARAEYEYYKYSIKAEPTTIAAIEKANVNIYPNPTNGMVAITLENSIIETIQISNMQGQVLNYQQGINAQQMQIDLSNYVPGVYVLEINGDKISKLILRR